MATTTATLTTATGPSADDQAVLQKLMLADELALVGYILAVIRPALSFLPASLQAKYNAAYGLADILVTLNADGTTTITDQRPAAQDLSSWSDIDTSLSITVQQFNANTWFDKMLDQALG